MTERISHPAVFAGLLGSAAWGTPTLALAHPLEDVSNLVSSSLVLQFVVGCVAGAAVAGTVSFVYDRLTEGRDDEAKDEESPDEERWSSSSVNIALAQARAQEEAEDDDPTGDLGRFRTGQITIDLPVLEASQEQKVVAEQKSAKPRHARHAKSPASIHVVAQNPSKRAGRHFTPAGKAEPVVFASAAAPKAAEAPVAAAPRARHFSTSTPVAPQQKTVECAPEPQPVVASHEAPKAERPRRVIDVPLVEPIPVMTQPAEPQAASSVAPQADEPQASAVVPPQPLVKKQDSSSVAKRVPQVTGRLRIRERFAARTKGVREVLSARLGDEALDGVPMIARADGSTVEVKPTWFDQTLVPAIAGITGVSSKLEDTASNAPLVSDAVATDKRRQDNTERAKYISRHVAEVNEGMFPERRSIEELDRKDPWEEALAAMGETLGQTNDPLVANIPVFRDVVGGPSTIDDPDGLEPPTGFIPFRVPASHPEVVDTETYVEYLLRDELSNNGSEVLRRSKHAHLRVIEGGTSPLRLRRRTGDTGPSKPARHFATSSFAREA